MVTRGNVAIYCYNALTAKTWDVVESTDGSLTSSSKGETILAKYFSDFVNDANQMKLVEDARVTLSGANTTEIGANQIKLEGGNIASFIDAERAPKKGKENVTYNATYVIEATEEDEEDVTVEAVVAYVPAEVAKVTTLAGKSVDVIFGKDNEVAYIAVTDDSMDRVFVTAWDNEDAEIELDGEIYEVKSNAAVYVLGHRVNVGGWTAIQVINEILATEGRNFEIAKPTKVFNRSVVADVILNEDGDIISINLIGSTFVNDAPVVEGTMDVEEAIVEKISNGKVVTLDSSVVNGKKLETLDDDKVTVIKNNEVISAEEIEANDVLTIISINDAIKTIYVSDAVVEGTVEKVKNNTLTIDGTAYNTSSSLIGNLDGDLEKATGSVDVEDYFEEDVTVYLNFVGEVVAVVAESEATNATLGMIVRNAVLRTDDNDVDYLSVKILTKDNKKSTYKIYGEDEDDVLDATAYEAGTMVLFTADADKEITLYAGTSAAADNQAKGIYAIESATADIEIDGEEVDIIALTGLNKTTGIDYVKETIKLGETTYRFSSSTVLYNNDTDKLEVASSWSAICGLNNAETPANDSVLEATDLIVVDGTRVRYCIFASDDYMSEEYSYAVLTDTDYKRNEDDDKAYFATLFVDGEETEYEVKGDILGSVEVGDFVKYTVSDGKLVDIATMIATADVADVEIDATATVKAADGETNLSAIKAQFEVAEVDEGYVYYTEKVLNPEFNAEAEESEENAKYLAALTELVIDEDGCIIYDLRDGSWEMFDGDVEDIEGLYVVAYEAEADTDTDVDVLVIFE